MGWNHQPENVFNAICRFRNQLFQSPDGVHKRTAATGSKEDRTWSSFLAEEANHEGGQILHGLPAICAHEDSVARHPMWDSGRDNDNEAVGQFSNL